MRQRACQVYCDINNKGVQIYLTLGHIYDCCGSYTNVAYVQWIVWIDHAYYYAKHHSVLIFNCTPNSMFTLLYHASVTAYNNTALFDHTKAEQVISTIKHATFIPPLPIFSGTLPWWYIGSQKRINVFISQSTYEIWMNLGPATVTIAL